MATTNAQFSAAESSASASGPNAQQPPKPQKSMTKAERRELQERQRAAKAQARANPGPSVSTPGASASSATSHPQSPNPQQSSAGQRRPRPSSGSTTGGALASTVTGSPNPQQPPAGQRRPRPSSGSFSVDKNAFQPQQRGLKIFSHFGLTKRADIGVKPDVVIHPAIIRLGLQFSEFNIVGSNARCIATLTAFKRVIQDYVTPQHTTLSRHLMTHLSPQITHLVSARPMSVTMGNAIRQLKLDIGSSDIDLPEQDAKDALCEKIDNYIGDRIIFADGVIENTAGKKIKDGDTILVYARSSIVEKVLFRAHKEGKRFSIIVVDSKPLLEGKALLKKLTSLSPSVPITYGLLPALSSLVFSTNITLALVGAHAIYSNGAVSSRAGTALVAMMCKQAGVPVVVCAETYKFAEGVGLDSFSKNELVHSDRSVDGNAHLEVLNPLYDLTPPSCVTAVVTEVGVIPPSSVSSIPLALGKTMLS